MAKTLAQELVTKFNIITGLLLRTGDSKKGNTPNADKMEVLLAKGLSEDTICNYIEDWHDENPNPNGDTAMPKFFTWVLGKTDAPKSNRWVNGVKLDSNGNEMPANKPAQAETSPFPVNTEEKRPVTSSETQDAAGLLTGMVNLISARVEDSVVSKFGEFIKENYDKLPRRLITVEYNGVKRDVKGITHEKFADVLFAVTHNVNVMLVGGAGSGKNVLCEQIAEAMGLPFRFVNAITYEHQLMGFTDANGTYHGTPFYDCWTNGGIFMLDEMDASSAEVFVKLNAALSGDTADFPAPIGNVKKHKDFHFIGAANTYGLGADYDYVGRNVLDAASRNRFITIPIDYDAKIEEAMADGDTALLNFCREFRKICKDLGIRAIVSYRNISQMAIMAKAPNINKATVIDYCLTAPMRYDDLSMIENKRQDCGEWGSAFHALVNKRKKEAA